LDSCSRQANLSAVPSRSECHGATHGLSGASTSDRTGWLHHIRRPVQCQRSTANERLACSRARIVGASSARSRNCRPPSTSRAHPPQTVLISGCPSGSSTRNSRHRQQYLSALRAMLSLPWTSALCGILDILSIRNSLTTFWEGEPCGGHDSHCARYG